LNLNQITGEVKLFLRNVFAFLFKDNYIVISCRYPVCGLSRRTILGGIALASALSLQIYHQFHNVTLVHYICRTVTCRGRHQATICPCWATL